MESQSHDHWGLLYHLGAAAAVLIVLTIPAQVIIFALSPPPETVPEWFALFNENFWIALLNMDLMYLFNQAFIVVVMTTLFVALRQVNSSLAVFALVVGLFGIAVHTTSNPCFDMLLLSRKHATAATPTEAALFLAAGEMLVVQWVGTAYSFGYFLGSVGIIGMSVVMWQSTIFSRFIAGAGVLAGVLWLVPPSFGVIGLALSFLGLFPMLIWLGGVTRQLLKLARTAARNK